MTLPPEHGRATGPAAAALAGLAGLAALLSAAACGGKPTAPATTPGPVAGGGDVPMATDDTKPLGQPCADRMLTMPPTDQTTFGPLEVGADWATYEKVSSSPWISKTHGARFVETYVNAAGAAAYKSEDPVPVGSTIVKISWENRGGKPTTVAGPIFVMRKEPAGYAPDHGDWSYGIHWAEPTPAQAKILGGPIYWRGKTDKVAYCVKCHDNYDRELGGIPPEHRAWAAK